jgi:hypothetical protein
MIILIIGTNNNYNRDFNNQKKVVINSVVLIMNHSLEIHYI